MNIKAVEGKIRCMGDTVETVKRPEKRSPIYICGLWFWRRFRTEKIDNIGETFKFYRIMLKSQMTDCWNEVKNCIWQNGKAEERKKYMYLRDTLSKDERGSSEQICETFCGSGEIVRPVEIFRYVSFRLVGRDDSVY